MRYGDIRTQLAARGSAPGDGQITKALKALASVGLVEKRSGSSRETWALTDLGEAVVAVVHRVKVIADPERSESETVDDATRLSMSSSTTATVGMTGSASGRPKVRAGTEECPLIDTTIPHPARRYNYWLGGKDNYAVDRESGDAIKAVMPTVELAALENRGFLKRAVEFLSKQGIRQFLDVGSGIPTAPNVHEIAQEIDPTARVVYVDHDPYVLVHSQALLTSTPQGRTAYIDGDLREPQAILRSPELLSTLELSQPVGLLLVAILHFIRDDENPKTIVASLVDALPSGSWVVVSHGTWDHFPPEARPRMEAANRDGKYHPRSAAELSHILGGLELMAPGVKSVSQWWSNRAPKPRPSIEDVAIHGAVGRVPPSSE